MAEETPVNTEISDDELNERIQQIVGTTPMSDEKPSVYAFLNNVAMADDTTKTGYLKDEELGNPRITLRGDKSLALISSEIMENSFFRDYFLREGEITTSTSLSRDALLLKLAVTTKKEIADVTKPKVVNKGWFKKKEPE